MDGRPGIHRSPDVSALPRAPLRVRTTMPIDKGTRVGGVMQEFGEGGLGRFAPEPLPRI